MNKPKYTNRHPHTDEAKHPKLPNNFPEIFATLPQKENEVLENFSEIVQGVKPLNSKQFAQLPYIIRDLSHQLTDERSSRRIGYMNETSVLSAYVRYFSWWNLIRLTKLFAGLPSNTFNFLQDDNAILDIGSGPLTVPTALWIARPELRSKKLTCYCLDLSTTSMSLGEDIFLSVASRLSSESDEPWRIVRVKGSLGTSIRQKVSFISCANMFNELFQDSNKTLEELAKKYSEMLLSYTKAPYAIFIAEPGVPRSARLVSLMRDAFIRKNCSISSPCPHIDKCPMDGRKGGKWCHFAFSTENAPTKLLKLSKDAGLPKERATISFVLAVSQVQEGNAQAVVAQSRAPQATTTQVVTPQTRVISDSIRLPYNKTGRYGCSKDGLMLVLESPIAPIESGSLVKTKKPVPPQIDEKTGASIVTLF